MTISKIIITIPPREQTIASAGGFPPKDNQTNPRRSKEGVMSNILEMKGIEKAFFGVTVLDKVDFSVEQGEVHALLGENGAGKSTLMNILAGVYTRDGGEVVFDGKPLVNTTVQKSENAGIAFVHQEINVFNDLKVYENIFMRKEIAKFGVLNKRAMIKQSRELFERLGVDIEPTELVSTFDTAKKQLLEIAKALFVNAKLIILDEPTTALSNEQIEHLFSIVNRLKKEEGVSFIFISHKMNEIFTIADRYTVLRNGEMVGTGNIADTDPESVTRLMVGSSYSAADVYSTRELGEEMLRVENLSGEGFHDVNFAVRRGEVVGMTGLKGAGVSEAMQAIFGAVPATSGKIFIEGKEIHVGTIHKAMKHRVAMVAANRKENSVIPDMSLLENGYIAEHTISMKQPVIIKKREIKRYNERKEQLSIKANSYNDLITSLSGGNQQKVILARWLNTDADILLLDNPTQGIDVGAKAEIYKLILKLAEEGKTILVNTLEIPEVQKVADRCIVFYHGTIKKVLERGDINEETVMLHATNAIQEEAVNG